jgi:hypothetical protein
MEGDLHLFRNCIRLRLLVVIHLQELYAVHAALLEVATGELFRVVEAETSLEATGHLVRRETGEVRGQHRSGWPEVQVLLLPR